MSLPLTAEAARQLAYYEAEVGVLAPRGWHCFGAYSSGGSELYVSPEPLSGAEVLSRSWNGLTGPAIELAVSDGNTAGRLDVARVIARVFPEQKAFVNEVIKEERLPAGDLSYGPYAADKLTYRGKTIVEYKTPADTEGLGTMSRLKKDAGPIDGVAILLGQTPPGLVQLSVRLPANLSAFTPTIIQQTERDTATATGSH